ncbi:MAG: SAM-dependent methyltransferase [Gammaproteobacteria bacterium RIFCSPHIGHO2_12_FULL_38_14]|nr:MAG: SAM-dependent methyltransferase [Gammaproteobacteria bacterium RIFCSPHIGHO2_12_FULL_38_14]
MKCRHCQSTVTLPLIDLGHTPPSNAYLTEESLKESEQHYPLRVLVCERCWLAQTEDFAHAENLFNNEYAYFSGFSDTWLSHCKTYVNKMINRFKLTSAHHVVEVASNDGSLLQYIKACQIPCTGIEPTASTASAARQKDIPTIEEFFGVNLAKKLVSENKQADLMIANNVLAHVPDINDFASAFAILLKENGAATFEFPHLLQLIKQCQFDTIYHEHYSYLSLTSVNKIFNANGLSIFDVEEIETHGGSLRVFAQRGDTGKHAPSENVKNLLEREIKSGLKSAAYYQTLQLKANRIKEDFLKFLKNTKKQHKKVIGYGAAAKGNTLLNYANVNADLIPFIADKNPAKKNKFMPGSHIPIVSEKIIEKEKPDYVFVLPWNIQSEVMQQLNYIKSWGGKFVTAIPKLEIFS